MRNLKILFAVVAFLAMSCASDNMRYYMKHYTLDFEGAYWDGLVDSNPNGDNLLGGTIAREWHDEKSDIVGKVLETYPGWWEGMAISNHCSKEYKDNGTPNSQLYAYVEKPHSGKNFLICNSFSGEAELCFKSKTSFIGSMMVANTTYSYAEAIHAQTYAPRPLGANESIWIEARGYINGSDEVQATAIFYLYENGQPAFEGWKKWYMTSMCEIDRVVFTVKWNGAENPIPYPSYFAIDDIDVVRKELK